MSIIEYLRSAQAELKKVSWPSKKDTVRYSSLVIGVSVVVAVFFTVLDRGLQAGVTATLRAKQATSQQNTPTTPTAPTTNPLEGITVTPTEVQTQGPTGTQTQPVK